MDLFSTGPFGLLPKTGDPVFGLPPGLGAMDDPQEGGPGPLAYPQMQPMQPMQQIQPM